MKVELLPVPITEKQHLSDLLDQYLDELSRYAHKKFPKPYVYLDTYFVEPSRKPFFIQLDDQVAGFALVNLKDPLSRRSKQAISEFYIIPQYRHKHIGEKTATQLFDLYPGNWIIREVIGNPAYTFWKKIINKYTNGNYLEYDQTDDYGIRKVQEFTNVK